MRGVLHRFFSFVFFSSSATNEEIALKTARGLRN